MAAIASTYDLMLLLDVNLDDAAALEDPRRHPRARAGQGTVVSDNEYGRRSMAYEIDHQPDVDYALLQFQGPPALLEQLSRTLRITDGVVRFRVIKIRPDAPAAPDLRQSAVPAPEAAEAVAEPAAG